MDLRFGLQIPSFTCPAAHEIGPRLRDIAQAGKTPASSRSGSWIIFVRSTSSAEWHDMLDSYTALGYVAAATRRVRLAPWSRESRIAISRTSARSSPLSIAVGWAGRVRPARRGSSRNISRRVALSAAGRALRAARGRAAIVTVAVGPGAPAFEARVSACRGQATRDRAGTTRSSWAARVSGAR